MKKQLELLLIFCYPCKKLFYFQSDRNEKFSISVAFKNRKR